METELAPIGETRLKSQTSSSSKPQDSIQIRERPKGIAWNFCLSGGQMEPQGDGQDQMTPHSVTVTTKARGCCVLKSFMECLL